MKVIKKKEGFLLLELLIALATFIFFMSICSWFLYLSFQTKNMAVVRSKVLNKLVNGIEYKKIDKKIGKIKSYSIKISNNLDPFEFLEIEGDVYNIFKKKQRLVLIGPKR
ncbi:hypothetical protein GF385_04555 [Candidatus Dependentiae bacterium]|nr:hypothetical protein [Candidatus Dependentiae bacterium]